MNEEIKKRVRKKIENWNKLKGHSKALDMAIWGSGVLLTTVLGKAIVVSYQDRSEMTTLQTATLNDEANTKLLTAAFENDLEDFKQALKDGAKISIPNQRNQNVLMIALTRDSYDVSGYILSTPELRDNIDYKQADNKGVTAMDIIQSKIDCAIHNTGRHGPEEPAPELEMAKRIVTQQLQKQNQEEANGQARSNTKYDAFAIAMQNKGNTGK